MSVDGNPRNMIHKSSLERTIEYLNIIENEDLDERVKNVFLLLGEAFPSGTKRDIRGASYRQLSYICRLAGIRDDDSLRDLTCTINRVGGLDSLQAHVIINKLTGST